SPFPLPLHDALPIYVFRTDRLVLPFGRLLWVEPTVRHGLGDHGEHIVAVLVGGADAALGSRGVIFGHGAQCSGNHPLGQGSLSGRGIHSRATASTNAGPKRSRKS